MASCCPWRAASISHGPSNPDRCRSRLSGDTQQLNTLPALSLSGQWSSSTSHSAQAVAPCSQRETVSRQIAKTDSSSKHGPSWQDPAFGSRAFSSDTPGRRGGQQRRGSKARASRSHCRSGLRTQTQRATHNLQLAKSDPMGEGASAYIQRQESDPMGEGASAYIQRQEEP